MKKIFAITFLLILMSGAVVFGEDLTGVDLLLKMDEKMKTEQKYMEEEMILYTSSGSERHRKVKVWNKSTDGDNMLLKFVEPASVEGTGFLMIEDDMWLYLPALGKVKRIAGSAKQGSFMGSDLSYEDMEALGSSGFSEDYKAELLKKEKIENRDTYLLNLSPVDGELSYSKLEVWIDSKMFLPLQIFYYNENGEKIKELKTFNYKMIDGRWTSMKMQMKNLQKESMTVLKVNEISFGKEIEDKIFSTRFLEMGN